MPEHDDDRFTLSPAGLETLVDQLGADPAVLKLGKNAHRGEADGAESFRGIRHRHGRKPNVANQTFLTYRDKGHDELFGGSEPVDEGCLGQPAKGPLV